ncbi:UDP-N-acetylmuramoyl-tripeptide--D-alanyl-D-alanine ligase [Glaciihabitans sp. dw_435]|uniref:UDP-N-acetylmuramoyl-tripeptide--D-alanyl-D- alanine ligase n=1 Tax=Glaciihabitans sp. dw_435 TaxID=2720081 RepID=UPI001BD40596|nr:UDP-N-acetylmuramoyl-tripeptide--D-alanyl-D-alanine ligase [Glaciihabitans sp. dw_435]
MIALTLSEISSIVAGKLVSAGVFDDTEVSGTVHTDSRLVAPGDIFFALPGDVTDGHLFAPAAISGGAALLITERELDVDVPQVVVSNGVAALAALATEVVARVRAAGNLSVVAITGSNGKTTTKNLLRAILSEHGPTVAPQGSFNNHVGAPISMLGIDMDTRYLIVEMGASGSGEIARLVAIAKPDIGVVLKVGLAHVGEFGGIDEVQKAKAEMVTSLPETAVAVLNADDFRVAAMAGMTAAHVRYFGLDESADVHAADIEATATGTSFSLIARGESSAVHLRILGEHHVLNALAAFSVADELGIDRASTIASLEAVARAERWRMEVLIPREGIIVINDAYNASPDSTVAALKTLAQIVGPGQRSVAVLGEMAELGEYADEEHDRVGRLAVRLNVQKLVVVGHRARHIHNAAGLEGSWDGESMLVDTPEEAYAVLRDELREGDVVLVKSSKSAGLRFLGDRLGGVAE